MGPTLVEDPESAELLDLLPDVVDSARSAADAIAPAGRLDGAGQKDETVATTPGWTEGERRLFKDSLLEILRNATSSSGGCHLVRPRRRPVGPGARVSRAGCSCCGGTRCPGRTRP